MAEPAGGMFVVSDTQLRYLQPARLDNELLVTAQLTHIARIPSDLLDRLESRP